LGYDGDGRHVLVLLQGDGKLGLYEVLGKVRNTGQRLRSAACIERQLAASAGVAHRMQASLKSGSARTRSRLFLLLVSATTLSPVVIA
jgi:class 3 adenylate cyclase